MIQGWISVAEAIKMTGYSRWWVVKLCHDEKLNCVKFNHMWAIERDSFLAYCERVGREVTNG
mgnify:CR=1 FL=1